MIAREHRRAWLIGAGIFWLGWTITLAPYFWPIGVWLILWGLAQHART
jgi:hypothetical protein